MTMLRGTLSSTRTLSPIVFVLVASLPLWLIQTNFVLSVVTLTFVFMSAALGWNIISGFGGQISFGHSVFFGIGAYSTAILQWSYSANAYVGLLLGVVVAAIVAVLLGWLTLRLRGIYFALATFAVTLVFAIFAGHYAGFTGGQVGITLPLLGNNPQSFSFGSKLDYYYIALLLAAFAFVVTWLVLSSRLGLQLRAIRADQGAAQACGVEVFRIKVAALVLSAMPTTMAGFLYVQYIGFVDPESVFGATVATQIAVIAFVGGSGKLWGPVVGAALLVPLQQLLNSSLSAFAAGVNLVVYGLVVVVILLIEPRGLLFIRLRRDRKTREAESASFGNTSGATGSTPGKAPVSVSAEPPPISVQSTSGSAPSSLLQVEELTVRFGGLLAVNQLTFDVNHGELLGIIGPNGAGKTTAFNAIAGAILPTSGSIHIGSRKVDGLPPESVAKLGIARTFQTVRLFQSMTVGENIALGALAVSGSKDAARAKAQEISELLAMEQLMDKQVMELPLADQKKVEIARGLGLSPRLLLLDEMMSGLNAAETREIIRVVKQLNEEQGLTIVIIEHVIRVIMELSHRVLVLDQGQLIAEGAPRDVMQEARVVEAYLGRSAASKLEGPA